MIDAINTRWLKRLKADVSKAIRGDYETKSDHPDYVKFKPLTKMQFGQLVAEQGGLCATCSRAISI